jgi:two-component system response regulator AtoC
VMERAVLLASGGVIAPEHLPLEKMRRGVKPAPSPAVDPAQLKPVSSLVELEKQAILDALVRCAGNQSRAAELLGMPRRTFCKRLAEYKITRPRA